MKSFAGNNHSFDGFELLNQKSSVNNKDQSNRSPRLSNKQSLGIFSNQSAKNKILNSLSEKAFQNISASINLIQLNYGDNIYQSQEKIRFFYFPETAICAEFEILENGKMIELVMTGREGFTGVSSLFNSRHASKLTQVLQTGSAWRVEADALTRIINNDAEIKEIIGDYLKLFINQISQKIVCHGFHRIEERLCAWFLMLQDRTGTDRLELTHEQIALSLGTNRPSISVITKNMRKNQMIEYGRGKISILNRNKLESVACPCYVPIN